ncbi:esterase/lipase family protein [Rhodococcus daqingensis]|uniref:Esterase/lipase family protein n=1 Tax=Rhodococcus daqingensis TaxID=2479363 RepID=A0ABW2RXY0_9NOCA
MNARLRAVATSLAAVAMFVLGSAIVPAATASAQSASTGSAGAQDEEPPAGANDWSCRPSQQHPRPVVLLHGTGWSMKQSLPALTSALKADGYCVYALNYGGTREFFGLGPTAWGTAAIEGSARELAAFVDRVRESTGVEQVDIVGHSQGGMMPRQYLKFEHGADPVDPARNKVRTLVMLGPSTHGTTFDGARPVGVAMNQQLAGSAFLTNLNAGQETYPGIDYTVIATKKDKTITPPESSFLIPAPGTSVRNMFVQDVCQDDSLEVAHSGQVLYPDGSKGLLDHPVSLFLVRKALDPTLQGTIPCSG